MKEKQLSAEQHRMRQENLLAASTVVNKCLRRFTIENYLPGQVTYNLGEYPARFSITPTDYDYRLLSKFAEQGAQVIQLHEEYNDAKRIMGADKFNSHDPEGLRRFVDLVHSLGMKIILYFSSGYFDRTDPDFRTEWGYPGVFLKECYYDYANCSPASPEWRAYLLPRLARLMDDYGVDGLYNDLGYVEPWKQKHIPPTHISPEPETPEHDAALEDLLGMIMNLVHRRSGMVKLHYTENKLPKCFSKIYDYLWVGESVKDLDGLRESTKRFPPYVIPCPDLSRAQSWDEEDLYLHTIPYMQFPLRVDGRPVTGERGFVPGVDYGDDFWTEHFHRIHEYTIKHPDGPYVYGWWDSSYGRPEARKKWFHYLELYRPMVSENTWCWVEIQKSRLFKEDLPEGITASLFVNEQSYLVLANYGASPVTVATSWRWRDRESGIEGMEWILPPRKLKLLEKVGNQAGTMNL